MFFAKRPHIAMISNMNTDGDGTRVYLDYGAATPLAPEVYRAMEPYWSEMFGNAGSLHADGLKAKRALEGARGSIAELLGAHADEIVFTSGGTESNNLAVVGLVRALRDTGRWNEDIHLITTAIEHSSVHDCFRALHKEGIRVTYLPVDEDGLPNIGELRAALTLQTVLVSAMYASNEIGTVLPLAAIAKEVRAFRKEHATKLFFHTDASQAFTWLPSRVDTLGVDLMTIDGQKAYGPKGAGLLYKARSVSLAPIMYGGTQEYGLRPGTPNTPHVVGLARALELAHERRDEDTARIRELRDFFIERVARIEGAVLNGHPTKRIANNANFSFPGLESERIVIELDAQGISVSTRSACLGESGGGSYVVRALGKGEKYANSSVRFTFGRMTTRGEVEQVVSILEHLIPRIEREKLD